MTGDQLLLVAILIIIGGAILKSAKGGVAIAGGIVVLLGVILGIEYMIGLDSFLDGAATVISRLGDIAQSTSRGLRGA